MPPSRRHGGAQSCLCMLCKFRRGCFAREFTLNNTRTQAPLITDKPGQRHPRSSPVPTCHMRTSHSQDSRGRTWQLPWAMPPGHHVSSASNADAPSGLLICTPFFFAPSWTAFVAADRTGTPVALRHRAFWGLCSVGGRDRLGARHGGPGLEAVEAAERVEDACPKRSMGWDGAGLRGFGAGAGCR